MKKILKKLRSKRGETLVGILIAILIIALSAGLFATMYSASMNINLTAQKQDEQFYAAVGALEEMAKSENTSKGDLIYSSSNGSDQTITVEFLTEDGLTAYREGT